MESDMVNNKTPLEPSLCVAKVKEFFIVFFPEYKLSKEGTYMGYWWVEYLNERAKVIINFDGDIGGHFYIKLIIDGKEYSLWQYDKQVNKATLSNEENILFQLSVLKNFIIEPSK